MKESIKPIVEKLKEYICDYKCSLPKSGIPQETADTICERCQMETLLNRIENIEAEKADQIDKLYLEKCQELNRLKEQLQGLQEGYDMQSKIIDQLNKSNQELSDRVVEEEELMSKIEYCEQCGYIKEQCECKKQTNADKIRHMTDDELAEAIMKNCGEDIASIFCGKSSFNNKCTTILDSDGNITDDMCKRCCMEWLKGKDIDI